jgi:hypothetical protein
MTRCEYLERGKQFTHGGNIILGVWITVGLLGLILSLVTSFHHRSGDLTAILVSTAAFVVFVGAAPIIFLFHRYRARRYGLICPHCREPLNGKASQQVLSSGSCPFCNQLVLSDANLSV